MPSLSSYLLPSIHVEHFLALLNTPRPSYTHPDSPLTTITTHDTYYLPDGNLYLLVGTTMFNIHRHFLLRESRPWRDYLANTRRGRSYEDPLNINWDVPFTIPITPQLFTGFLWVFYNPSYSYDDVDEMKWLNIQSLAIIWDFDKVLDLTHKQLSRITRSTRVFCHLLEDEDLVSPEFPP